MSSKQRANTTSARLFAAQEAYDAEDYDTAATLLQDVIANDPDNAAARIQLAFTYNAQSHLSVIDFLRRALEMEADKSTGDELEKLSHLFAYGKSEEASRKITCNRGLTAVSNIEQLRIDNPALNKLQQTWLTLCPLFPPALLDTWKTAANSQVGGYLSIETCGAGQANLRASAALAGLLQALSQAMYLYQTAINCDVSASGDMWLVGQANAAKASIDNTVPTGLSAIVAYNKSLETLQSIKSIDAGPVSLVLAHLRIAQDLVSRVAGLPDSVKKKLDDSIAKLDAKRSQMSFSGSTSAISTDPTGGTSTAVDCTNAANTSLPYCKVQTAAQSASGKLEQAITAAGGTTNPEVVQACDNFAAVKAKFNLPANVQKPSNCP